MILTSIISAVIFLVLSSWVFNYSWSILPYLALAGCFIVWIQKESVTHKFLPKLVGGSLIFGILSAILISARMIIMSNLVYDSPIPISKLWDQDTWMMALVFIFVSFLGGLLGIILKGFYSLYKNKLDLFIVFIGPILALISSLAIYRIKIGGTVMSALYGWPYSFFIIQIKDVMSASSFPKWIFSPGSFYHYIIFDYLFYLAPLLAIYFALQLINKKLELKKINRTFVLFGVLVVISISLASFISVKRSYISRQIATSGYCQQDSDCKIIANRSPFSCAIVVNQDNAERILKLVNSFPSMGELQCSGNERASCIVDKCLIAIDHTSNETYWDMLKQAVENCEVTSVMQTHSLEVTAVLKSGRVINAKEPAIDDIFDIVSQAEEKCDRIRMATE